MLRSRLDTIARELSGELDDAVRMAAEAIEEGAKARAPIDSGELRDSIHSEKQADSSYLVIAGDKDAFYAHFVEYGTSKNSPHPFLLPAAEAERDNINARARRALEDL